jgi:hypothetical protein
MTIFLIFTFTHFLRELIKNSKTGRAYGTNGERIHAYKVLVEKYEENKPLRRHRNRREDNIKMDFRMGTSGELL